MPDSLLQPALGLELWQWVALPIFIALLALAGLALARLSEHLASGLAQRTTTQTDDRLVRALRSPLRVVWVSLLARVALPLIALPSGVETATQRLLRIAFGVACFWAVLRAVAVWTDSFTGSDWAQSRPGSRALVNLASRVTKFALIALAALAVLSELGYSVTSVLAGLGLGGLALALGAQKTLENVFGAFALAVDQPFREGDPVKVEDVVGTVETIGLRSTRIRTLDRTVVTIPNGKLSEMRLESFAPRDQLRLQVVLPLAYSTTTQQLKQVRDAIEHLLLEAPQVIKQSAQVRLTHLGASSLELEAGAYFELSDFNEFRALRERLLLAMLEAVENANTVLAYPTSTVHVVQTPR